MLHFFYKYYSRFLKLGFFFLFLLCLSAEKTAAQKIIAGEYFIDNDPGIGNGIMMTPFSSLDSVTVTQTVSLGNLPVGFHKVYFRFRDAQNKWGISEGQTFYVYDTITNKQKDQRNAAKIISGEYFIDTDPGVGKGFQMSNFSAGDSVQPTQKVQVGNTAPGFHKIYFRFKDEKNAWGMVEGQTFYVNDTAASKQTDQVNHAKITGGEYFIDQDPGIGKGFPMNNFVIGDSVLPTQNVQVGNTLPGFHRIYFRFHDEKNTWGLAEGQTFYIADTLITKQVDQHNTAKIVAAEYFIDTDPGLGKGINFPINTFTDSAQFKFKITLSNSISIADHYIYFRFKDEKGRWGLTESKKITVNTLQAQEISNYIPIQDKSTIEKPFEISVTTTSGLVPQYTIVSGPAVIKDSILILPGNIQKPTKFIFLNGTSGKVIVRIYQPGNAEYNPSDEIIDTFYVYDKQNQTLKFDPVDDISIGRKKIKLIASTSSGLPILFKVDYGPVELIGKDSLRLDSLGKVSITASQAGDSIYNAVDVSRTFFVTSDKFSQTITFDSLKNKNYNDPDFKLIASASSGLPITFKVISGPANLRKNDILSLTGVPGKVVIRASQPGNPFYDPAPNVDREFVVFDKASLKFQTITFEDTISDRNIGSAPFQVFATSDSKLDVVFSILSGPATISGNVVTITGTGAVTIQASQPGNVAYYPADNVNRTFNVLKKGFQFVAKSNNPICKGTAISLSVNALSGAIYKWTGPKGYVSNLQSPVITGEEVDSSRSGKYIVTAIVGPETFTDTIEVKVLSPKITIIEISPDSSSKCNSKVSKLYASGDFLKFQWYYNFVKIVNAVNREYIPVTNGRYEVKGFDENGCSVPSYAYYLNDSVNTSTTITIQRNPLLFKTIPAFSYQWYVENRLIVGATNQTYIPRYNGEYKVHVTSLDSCKSFSKNLLLDTSNFEHVLRSGLYMTDSTIFMDEFSDPSNAAIEIYPVPADETVTIVYKGQETEKNYCSITDVNGKIILKKKMSRITGGATVDIDIKSLNPGVYIAFIENDFIRTAKRLIIE